MARSTPRRAAPLAAAAEAAGAGVARSGLRTLDPQLNQQVAGAQQALNFLDRVAAQLQGMKQAFSGKLAEREGSADEVPLDQHLKQLSALMRQRQAATAGSLDGRLALHAPGEARQQFRIRGLDVKALVSGERETLSFAVAGQRPVSVLIDPELAPRAMISRIDHALMPTGIRVRRDAQGELAFSVAEAAWPEVRDALTAKGAGQRFPTGQFNRVLTEPEPELIRPETWRTDDTGAIRRTLQEIVIAVELVQRARGQITEVLFEASRRFERVDETDEATQVGAFVDQFKTRAQRPDFEVFSAIAPALIAISRHRVVALLSLG